MTEAAPSARAMLMLSLGAGVQSTTLMLLARDGVIPKPDVAIFSDTGWEPPEVYAHLDRLEREVAVPAGIPIVRLRYSDLRADVLGIGRMTGATIPSFTTAVEEGGRPGIVKRQCTEAYKIRPIRTWAREQLGAPISERPCKYCESTGMRQVPWLLKRGDDALYECTPCAGTGTRRLVLAPPRGRHIEQQIGISLDEVQRAGDSRALYMTNSYPLLDLKWTRAACRVYLRNKGWDSTPRSACIGCPYKSDTEWRRLRDEHPDQWADAVAFDRGLRERPARLASGLMHVDAYLHRSLLPLDEVPIDKLTRTERDGEQTDLLGLLGEEEAHAISCSPVSCAADTLTLEGYDELDAGDDITDLDELEAALA